MGEIMKITKGKIDPKKINTELKKELEKRKNKIYFASDFRR